MQQGSGLEEPHPYPRRGSLVLLRFVNELDKANTAILVASSHVKAGQAKFLDDSHTDRGKESKKRSRNPLSCCFEKLERTYQARLQAQQANKSSIPDTVASTYGSMQLGRRASASSYSSLGASGNSSFSSVLRPPSTPSPSRTTVTDIDSAVDNNTPFRLNHQATAYALAIAKSYFVVNFFSR